ERSLLSRVRRSLHECLLHLVRRISRSGRQRGWLFLRLERRETRLRGRQLALQRRRSESPPARSHIARSAMCFSEIKTTFLPLHTRNGGESLRRSAGAFPQGRGRAGGRVRAGENSGDLLRRGVDAAFQGSADHSCGCDLTVAPWKYWPARRWNSRTTRSCFHPGFDRYSYALRYSSRVPDNAAQRR